MKLFVIRILNYLGYHETMNFINSKSKPDELNQTKISSPLPRMSYAEKQKTLSKPISFSGIGLHTGCKSTVIIHPAPENTGYLFKLKNGPNSFSDILGIYSNVSSTVLCTTLSNLSGFKVSTTEHLLSALYGLEIDNVIIEVIGGNEIPILDGSACDFVDGINSCGLEIQNFSKKVIKIVKTIELIEGDKVIRVSPHDENVVTCEIDFESKLIGHQSMSLIFNRDIYTSQISDARTFGFLEQVKILRKRGLALGGNLENAIVISKDKVVSKNGLRYNNEFVRHKILDLIGDFSLAGFKIQASIFSYKAGHDLNNKLLRKIFSSNENWEFLAN